MKLLRSILGSIVLYNLLDLTICNHSIIVLNKEHIILFSVMYVSYKLL